MHFVNPPAKAPQNVKHRTFYSASLDHEIGYNIYLPPGYEESGEAYPVAYHLHGWTGHESSELRPMKKVYKNRRAITVFPNNSPVIEGFDDLPVEDMLIGELIPLIDREYRTDPARESRSISGFSMGGGMAFIFAVRHPELFGSVAAYAGTYHHYYHKGYNGVGAAPEKAAGLFASMMREERYLEEDGILHALRQNAEKIRGKLHISMHIGMADVLFCDNEIMHLYLRSLDIPHTYRIFEKAGHDLKKIL